MRYKYQDVKYIIEAANYELISKEEDIINNKGYVLTSTKIEVWCKNPKHKHSFPQLSKFVKGARCKQCYIDSTKLSYDYVKSNIEAEDYELISKEYIDVHSDLKIKHTECGYIFDMQYANFQQGQRCPKCGIKRRVEASKHSIEYIKNYVESQEYTLISIDGYKNSKDYIVVKCPNENHSTYKVTFEAFKNQGNRCPQCNIDRKRETFKLSYDEVKLNIEKEGYKLLSNEYINAHIPLIMQCPKEHVFSMVYSNFQQGQRCNKCENSKGEKIISNILDKLSITYTPQYRFSNCKAKQSLPFDFYLSKLNICIEYDGEQHYKYGCFNSNLLDLMNRKYYDNIKTQYCKDNNIKLIRIPYWEFKNIEKILEHELKL